jgi:hypothetical protein
MLSHVAKSVQQYTRTHTHASYRPAFFRILSKQHAPRGVPGNACSCQGMCTVKRKGGVKWSRQDACTSGRPRQCVQILENMQWKAGRGGIERRQQPHARQRRSTRSLRPLSRACWGLASSCRWCTPRGRSPSSSMCSPGGRPLTHACLCDPKEI